MGDPRLVGRRAVRLLPVLGAALLLSIGRAHARASKLNPKLRRSSTTSGGIILGTLDPAFRDFGTNLGSGVAVGIVDTGIPL